VPQVLKSARVLVVDDHPVNRRVLQEQIASWSPRNASCSSGKEALERLRR